MRASFILSYLAPSLSLSPSRTTASILYTAVVRGKVALPCDINPPSPEDSVALILWYKDDALTPIYTLDSRKGEYDLASSSIIYHFIHSGFKLKEE